MDLNSYCQLKVKTISSNKKKNNRISIKVHKKFGVSFTFDNESLISLVGCFDKKGLLHGFSQKTEERYDVFGFHFKNKMAMKYIFIEGLFKKGKQRFFFISKRSEGNTIEQEDRS